MKKIVIAIDGFSSCGKSTMAKQLAQKLNYIYVDSGAMYRGIALYFLQNKIDITNKIQINDALQNIELHFEKIENKNCLFLNTINVEDAIRTPEVANLVSPVATIKNVRKKAVVLQQQMGVNKGIVMDGRDIGTTVFPDAELKIFMTASITIRTQRRFLELKEKHPDISVEEVEKNLSERDFIDSNREISPLKQATDAKILDNSNLTASEQLQIAYNWAMELIN